MSRTRSVLMGLVVGVLAACWCAGIGTVHGHRWLDFRSTGRDFFQNWVNARALARGADPYVVGCPVTPPCADARQYYPATAGVAVLPLAAIPAGAAAVLFVGLSAGVLGFAIARTGVWRAPMLLSWPFIVAVDGGQWAPLLIAAALLPDMKWLYPVKPQLGLALFAWRPSWRAVVLGLGLIAVSLILMPTWPLRWWREASLNPYISSPLQWAWFAPVLLVAALRWRTPAARLLLAMAILPQTPFAYDQLALFLVPGTRREMIVLTCASWLAFGAWLALGFDWHSRTVHLQTWAPYLMLFLYLPCLAMVLRRPNIARVPDAVTTAETSAAA